MFKKGHKLTNNIIIIFLSIIIFLTIFLISSTNILYLFDKRISNLYFQFNDIKTNNNIVIVEIDEETLSGRKDGNQSVTVEGLGRFPFDRSYYAKVIENLNKADVSVIAFDIIFGEESNKKSDDIFSDSIKNAGNVILGLWTNSIGNIQIPYYKFGDYMLTAGYFSPLVDTNTNTVYSIQPYGKFRGNNKIYSHFSVSIVRGFLSKIYDNDKYLTEDFILLKEKILISDKIELKTSRNYKNEALINYTYSKNFNKISFLDIYNNTFNKELLKDKIVIIGATAKGIKDVFNTPLGGEYGVYLHANMVNTIISKNGIRYFNKNLEWLIIFLFIVLSVYFNIKKSSYILILSNIALISIFIMLVFYFIIISGELLNYPIELILALIISLTLSNIFKYLIENKNKNKLNKALSEYVSVNVANEILSGNGDVNLNGENKKISIFFSDIEGFTSISEKLSPEEVVFFLREYLTSMSNIIMDNKGFINKYEGDAIMGLWGVFGEKSKKDTYNACFSALKQQIILKDLNIIWGKRGFSEVKTRIGIHIGEAIIGNIGSEGRKMEFTALGDNVNLASRLEGVNKFYGTYICVSQEIYLLENNNFEFRYLDKIKVKGKNNSIDIYELLGFKGELEEKKEGIIKKFNKGVELYKNQMFKEALEIFNILEKKGDSPSITYKNRCINYLKKPPLSDWDGVWIMQDK